LAERARLAQDLLGNGELAEVVQPRRQPGQLDLALVGAEPGGDPAGEVGDPLGMAAAVRVARVDLPGEARRGATAGCAVGSLRELVEVRELERRRLVR